MKKVNTNKIVIRDMIKYGGTNRVFLYTKDQYKIIGKHNNLPIAKVIDNKCIHLNGFCLAMAQKQITNGYLVVFDDMANGCPKYVQRFLENHEVGHIKMNHITNNAENRIIYFIKRYLGIGKEIRMEYEADNFSANIIGRDWALESLLYIKRHFNLGLSGNIELKRRIRKIRKNAVE